MTLKNLNHTYDCLADKMKNCLGRTTCQQQAGPLSQRGNAGKIKICKVTGDRKLCARMASMGVYPGMVAELICPENGSQCLLKIHGGTVCLDRAVTENIIVSGI